MKNTSATIRHQERIATAKARIASAQEAQRIASQNKDYNMASNWLAQVTRYEAELKTLRTMPIHNITSK